VIIMTREMINDEGTAGEIYLDITNEEGWGV
jgi:hypothetical protein